MPCCETAGSTAHRGWWIAVWTPPPGKLQAARRRAAGHGHDEAALEPHAGACRCCACPADVQPASHKVACQGVLRSATPFWQVGSWAGAGAALRAASAARHIPLLPSLYLPMCPVTSMGCCLVNPQEQAATSHAGRLHNAGAAPLQQGPQQCSSNPLSPRPCSKACNSMQGPCGAIPFSVLGLQFRVSTAAHSQPLGSFGRPRDRAWMGLSLMKLRCCTRLCNRVLGWWGAITSMFAHSWFLRSSRRLRGRAWMGLSLLKVRCCTSFLQKGVGSVGCGRWGAISTMLAHSWFLGSSGHSCSQWLPGQVSAPQRQGSDVAVIESQARSNHTHACSQLFPGQVLVPQRQGSDVAVIKSQARSTSARVWVRQRGLWRGHSQHAQHSHGSPLHGARRPAGLALYSRDTPTGAQAQAQAQGGDLGPAQAN